MAVAAAAVVVTLVGIWASGRVERRLRKKDPQIVCIDEVAGVLVTWIAAPPTTRALVVGFVAFRVFDQLKPWPARAAERLKGGAGIMLDDVAAGVWGAALVLVGRAMGWL
jgi:phosphatidylglycerophosphatase A